MTRAPDAPRVVRLACGGMRVAVMPRLGGRILSLDVDGHELLWRNPALLDEDLRPLVSITSPAPRATFAQWQNWGGDKSWPAPQGWQGENEWPGPPDAVFDAGEFTVRECTGTRIAMDSADDHRTGLAMSRTVECTPDGLTVETMIRNTSEAQVRWSAWELAQFLVVDDDLEAPGAGVWVTVDPAGGRDVVRTIFSPHGVIATRQTATDVVHVPFPDAVGKLGFPAATGRIRLVRAHVTVDIAFEVERDADYPDDSPFQLWAQVPLATPLEQFDGLQPDARLIELEPLTPLRPLAPGERAVLRVVWGPQAR